MADPASWPYPDHLVGAAVREYGTVDTFLTDTLYADPERIRRLREQRLRDEVRRASRVPFYQRLWERAGFDPATFRGLEDLPRMPAYTVEDIRESLTLAPPYGDYQGVVPDGEQAGLRVYFSGGTTGKPRPTVYTAWDRLIGSLMVARSFAMHGARKGEVVVNAWSYGTHNGAWVLDEALWLWLGITPITTSTGNVTGTLKQLELARDYGAASFFATSDYLLHLHQVAADRGLSASDFGFRWFSTIGDTAAVARTWQAPVGEFYAFHEVQTLAADCDARNGMHIFEDAFIVEVVDTETGEPLPPGHSGDLVVTCLYKTGSPQLRYNIKDLSQILAGTCSCGSTTARMGRLEGRSDTMVKLRGINVWPEAVGAVIEEELRQHVEYFCVAIRNGDRDDLAVLLERPRDATRESLQADLAEVIRQRIGTRVDLRVVPEDSLASLTGRGEVTKLRRYLDARRRQQLPNDIARHLDTR